MTAPNQTGKNDTHRDMDAALDDSFFEIQLMPSPLYNTFDFDPPKYDFFPDTNLISDTETFPTIPITPEPTTVIQESEVENKAEMQDKDISKLGSDFLKKIDMQRQAITTYKFHLKSKLFEKEIYRMKPPRIQPHLSDLGIKRSADTNLQNARQGMRAWLVEHWMNPYLKPHEARAFAQQFGMTVKQVRTFFTNERNRFLQRKGCTKHMSLDKQITVIRSTFTGERKI